MYLQKVKQDLAKICEVEVLDFVYPPQKNMGDISLPAFSLAKKFKGNAISIATDLAKKINENKDFPFYLEKVLVQGPYLNFFLARDVLAKNSLNEINETKSEFGKSDFGGNKKVMLEYSNVNTHKDYHIGHLRNICLGNSLARVFNHAGYDAISVSYVNDFGIHVAKTLWGWQHESIKKQLNQEKSPGHLLGVCYALASKELLNNELHKEEVFAIMKSIEKREGDQYSLWQETKSWSVDYFAQIYKELDVKFSHIFYESEFINEGLKIVDEFLQKGIFKNSEGAIIADLEEYDLGVLPIIRSDGTALYPVADLALAREKFVKYDLEESIYIVDVRQGLYFQQLKKIFELSKRDLKISHLGYDFVTLKSGMMSSRSGNIITYQELINEAKNRALIEIKKRHEDWDEEKSNSVAQSLAKSAIKFEMIKVGSDKVIVFDLNEALRFDGYTSAYLQYSGARLASILRKSDYKIISPNTDLLISDKEKDIIIDLQKLSEIILHTANKRDPSLLARYVFELAQSFNDYYHSVPILKADKDLAIARLFLLKSIQEIFKNVFNLLGIDYLEEM